MFDPTALGARISGVDDHTFSSTGEAYSAIREFKLVYLVIIQFAHLHFTNLLAVLPDAESTRERELQADDVSLGARALTTTLTHTHTLSLSRCSRNVCVRLLAAYEL